MTTHPDDELRALRARAYGPNADIHDDPHALQRLRDLEGSLDTLVPEEAKVREAGADEARDAAASALESSPRPEVVSDVAKDPAADLEVEQGPASSAAPRRERRRRRLIVWWVASLLLAVIVAVSVTAFVSRRVQADPREVAVLGVDLGYDATPFFGGDEREARAFGSFYGLRTLLAPVPWMNAGLGPCLIVFDESQMVVTSESTSGPSYNGCGAGDFPTTLELMVTSDLPSELREQFPVGSALQFVLDGDEVIVLSDLPR